VTPTGDDLSPLLSWLVAHIGRDVEVRLGAIAFVMSGRLLRVEEEGDVLVVHFAAQERERGPRAVLRIWSDAQIVGLGARSDEDPADDFIAFHTGEHGVSVLLRVLDDEAV
jgi:hypothetical protein